VHLEGHPFFVHVFDNHKNAKKEQLQRFRALTVCQKELESLRLGQYQLKTYQKIRQRVDQILQKHKVKTFLKVEVKKPRGQGPFQLNIQPRKRALSKAQNRQGRFALITDRQGLTSKDVLTAYRSKDKAESAFSVIKGPVALRPVFHYSPQRIKAHVFICHLALFLRNLLDLLLKAKDIDLTPQKALKRVKEVHITKIYFQKTKQTFWILNQVDPEVQKIFDAVALNPHELLAAAGLSPP
jgi:transposase